MCIRDRLSVVFRYDGISKLKDNRWGFFPGVSAGWNITEEQFWKDSNVSDFTHRIRRGHQTSSGTSCPCLLYTSYVGRPPRTYPGTDP